VSATRDVCSASIAILRDSRRDRQGVFAAAAPANAINLVDLSPLFPQYIHTRTSSIPTIDCQTDDPANGISVQCSSWRAARIRRSTWAQGLRLRDSWRPNHVRSRTGLWPGADPGAPPPRRCTNDHPYCFASWRSPRIPRTWAEALLVFPLFARAVDRSFGVMSIDLTGNDARRPIFIGLEECCCVTSKSILAVRCH
jgi:hypothetical protein